MSVDVRAMALKGLGLLSLAGASLLAGCGAGMVGAPASSSSFKITGNVHGGAYPIQGATIRLMETQSNGAWNSTTDSYKGTAKQLLQTTSDRLGNFTFPDTGWTCDAGQYAYITVSAGHTAAQNNFNVVQVGVIGSCSGTLSNKTQIDNVNVYISELSTVAAAYALGNFITIDNTNASTGQQIVNITAPAANNSTNPGCTGQGTNMNCVHAGLGNAFKNAYNLVDQVTYGAGQAPTGTARAALPGNSQATVPQALINTLGNILQSCVDSAGGTVANYGQYTVGGRNSTQCGDLFYLSTPPGTTTSPTNTLQTAINMARYPNNNVDALFNLQPRAVFFTPQMTSDKMSSDATKVMSLTLSVFYVGTGLTGDLGMPFPLDVVLDEDDNAYVLYSGGSGGNTYGAVNAFQPDGTGLFAGTRNVTIPNPGGIAVDSAQNVFISNDAAVNGNVYLLNTPATGGVYGTVNQTITVPGGYASGIALDLSNNVWATRDASDGRQSLFRFRQTFAGTYNQTNFQNSPVMNAPSKRVFVDFNQNVLGVTSGTTPLGVSNSSAMTQVYLFPYGGSGNQASLHTVTLTAKNGNSFAMDNSDVLYAPVYKELDSETGLNNGQMNANGAGSYTGMSSTNQTYAIPMGVALDGGGNLFWSNYEASGQVFWMQPTTAGDVSAGTLTSFFPCYPMNGQCYSNAASYLRGMAIDSSGAIWYTADSTTGAVVQTLGLAQPSYPLLSYARGSVIPQ